MKIKGIEGTITLTDGSTSMFYLGEDGGWSQWGADHERLGETGHVLDSIAQTLMEDDALVSCLDDDEDMDLTT